MKIKQEQQNLQGLWLSVIDNLTETKYKLGLALDVPLLDREVPEFDRKDFDKWLRTPQRYEKVDISTNLNLTKMFKQIKNIKSFKYDPEVMYNNLERLILEQKKKDIVAEAMEEKEQNFDEEREPLPGVNDAHYSV